MSNGVKQSTILVVDDSETNIEMVLAILDNYDVIPATCGKDALDIAANEHIDLILLDILMPEMSGFEVCKKLKENEKTKFIPVIFLTAQKDEDSIEAAYLIGGVDYVTKPFKPVELLARVKVHLKLQNLIQRLQFLATRDSLTGIYNRRKFFELAEQMFATYDENLYAIMLDIDFFKRVNDNYGHDAGDIVLQKTTEIISGLLPLTSVFGRLGGEEFGVILTAPSYEKVIHLLDKIVSTYANTDIKIGPKQKVRCTISCGMSPKYKYTSSIDELLKEADAALYEAKKTGRNKRIVRAERR
ncbi:diguanylate cyclase [Halodesulfovibrio marinisediminis]|uniref:diguanylate cyclase n=1 Tax=Halodesulfovibrio marinisediminis DSM 17456 TaxID=1121457 RepID=A0A1N6E941_9BACT|nr:diguanylate cyclase [Halodesulfovibrio marinisediminis]SIN79471.1 diguanylate cyclase (GGDEF) domain-containing protein [Halodesulfovibrio marinisediminis DSM 17456]